MNYVDPSGHEPKYGEGACYEIDCKNANGTEVTYGNGKGGEPKVNAPKTCQTSGVYCDSENNIDVIIEDTYKYGKIFGYFFRA